MYLYASGIDVASFNDFGSVISGWYFFSSCDSKQFQYITICLESYAKQTVFRDYYY
jgi:hypothetical protein